MIRLFSILAITLIILSVTTGCSSHRSNPVLPTDVGKEFPLDVSAADVDKTGHTLLGFWTIEFDLESLTATVIPNRELNAHLNVTRLIPPPGIHVNSYDPLTDVVDVDVTLKNPFTVDAFDIRAIIFADAAFHRLLNPDAWTALYDIPGGETINPFKAYAKSIPNRRFASHQSYIENMQIYLPQGNRNVQFAVDASYPGNCGEPYAFENFTQVSLFESVGSSALLKVNVLDWQEDVNEVQLSCPAITGQPLVPFEHLSSSKWQLNLVNNTGAHYGEYPSWIIARSSNSGSLALFEPVIITVKPGESGIPSNPQIIGSLIYLRRSCDVAMQGNYAYIADFKDGLKIADISDPRNPRVISSLSIGGDSIDVAVSGNYAYVANKGALQIINVSNPYNPQKITSIGEEITDVMVGGQYAYACGEGVSVIDISNPSNPSIIHKLGAWTAKDAAVEGNRLYYVYEDNAMEGGLRIYENFVLVNTLYFGYPPHSVAAKNNYVFYSNNLEGVTVLDLSDPDDPETAGGFGTGDWNPNELFIQGNYIYVADYHAGLTIADISDPTHCQVVANSEPNNIGYTVGVAALGNVACSADDSEGIRLFDVSDPPNTSVISIFDARGDARGVAIKDDNVYISNYDDKTICVDVFNPESPKKISDIGNYLINNTAISGNYAYGSGVQRDLVIMNISDPQNPTEISVYNRYGSSNNLAIEGFYACAAVGYFYNTNFAAGYLEIIDVSNQASPQLTGYVDTHYSNDVVIAGDNAFVADESEGLKVIDIHDPSNPTIIGSVETDNAKGVAVSGDYAFIADYSSGLVVIDISDPTNPEITGSYPVNGGIDVEISGDYAYMSVLNSGLRIIDIRNPSSPSLLSSVTIPGKTYGIKIVNNLAYIAAGLGGMRIVKLWD